MEVVGFPEIVDISRFHTILDSPEVLLVDLGSVGSLELLIKRWNYSNSMLSVDGLTCRLRKRLAIEVLRLQTGDIPLVSRNVLGSDIVSGSTDPVLAVLGEIAKLQVLVLLILLRWLRVECSLSERW